MERIGKFIWNTAYFQELRHRIGETSTRRVVALAMLSALHPGIFGVFFLLENGNGMGLVVFQRILVDGVTNLIRGNIFPSSDSAAFVFLHIIIIMAYFFNHVCLDCEPIYKHRKTV
ncbi:hypothetical protein KIN20_017547 [Parelaphostrongylus tenuis]|uniref:Uncharacterized protein n=1 Tax=Parelaphostrongylus tenuis TaxID=148309 RepID=A0AAD5QTV7_PARTN|nr:hypothetical protein KIN20_017547 [Parelaphostrongylus tenuis]